jgi:rhamnose utilization protein RhaD (predicted bifunctional aldolase and dehydrogenase)
MSNDVLARLVSMSRHLGDPALDCVILGEGNTSARADADTFWVKASGTELRTIDRPGFVRVSFDRALAILEASELTKDAASLTKDAASLTKGAASLTDAEVNKRLAEARVDPATGAGPAPDDGVRPSVETVLHAICLSLEGVNFVGHTHPTVINALTCSVAFETAVSGRLFPDEIVLCGPAPVVVPYTDPGLPLARRVRDLIEQYIDEHHEHPRVILMQNHGMIALGRTARQVENITAMAVKTARVLLGTYVLGGPHFLTAEAVDRIHTRPDELYRRGVIGE